MNAKNKPKSKTPPSQEFQDVCLWYKMEVANYSFEVVRDALKRILEAKWDERAPEHYLSIVGLICVYARPFTNNFPVGRLSEEIIPTQFKKLHDEIMLLRDKLFAHADASYVVGKDDYLNEVVIEYDGVTPRMTVPRTLVRPAELEAMVPLVEALFKKTHSSRLEFEKKYAKAIQNLGEGEFRLNVVEPDGPMFIPLTEDEKLVRQRKRSALDINATV